MSEETPLAAPVYSITADAVLANVDLETLRPAPPLPPDPEQLQAIDAAFVQEQREREEHDTVAGLLGLWTGTMLLHGLAIETFAPSVDEEVEEDTPKKKDKKKP